MNFPFGFSEKHAPHLGKDTSSLDTALERGSGDAEMLDAISVNLPTILDSFEPSLVLYDAGADAHEVDGLGHLELSDAGMLALETAFLRECASRQIPVATVIGGGYEGMDVAWRGATLRSSTRARVWRRLRARRVPVVTARRTVGDVAATAGSTRRHGRALRGRPVASAAAGLRAGVAWGALGNAARLEVIAMYPVTLVKRRVPSAKVAARDDAGATPAAARARPSVTDSTHATSAADGCPSPQRASTEEPNSGP